MKTVFLSLSILIATAASASDGLPYAIPSAVLGAFSVNADPAQRQYETNSFGSHRFSLGAASAGITIGAVEAGVPFIAFDASSTDAGNDFVSVNGDLQYQWSIVGDAAPGLLIPVTLTTMGFFRGQVTGTALTPDYRVGVSAGALQIELSSRFNTNGEFGLDSRSYGISQSPAQEPVNSPYGGSVTSRAEASFSETFTILVQPNSFNSITMSVIGGASGFGGPVDFNPDGSARARWSYAITGYIDPIIIIDAAFADRFSVVQGDIPIVAVPVPEASTLAMMLGGLGLLGCTIARRRRA